MLAANSHEQFEQNDSASVISDSRSALTVGSDVCGKSASYSLDVTAQFSGKALPAWNILREKRQPKL
jgi:hypothetical protein